MAQRLRFSQQDRFPSFNLGDISPASPDSITMPGVPRPTAAGMRAFAQYASLPTQGQSTGGIMTNLQTLGSGHTQQSYTQSQGLHPMNQFMHDQGPWVPLNLEGVSSSQNFSSFNEFRSPAPPSEADTVNQSVVGGFLSDSGYESMPARRSVGNPSNYGDADQSMETQNLISRFQGMPSVSSKEDARKREARGQRPSVGTPRTKGIVCPDCHALVKTNSELKKHQARHNKPWKCDVPDCPKTTEGFSTSNDLDRHKRCVHKLRTGDVTVYRCDVDQCKDKAKDWPRQDNFKQHLRRKHNLENVDLSRFAFRSSSSSDLTSHAPSESVAAEEAVAISSDSTSQPTWAGLDRTHVAPSSLITGNAGFSQDGHMVPYPGPPTLSEGDLASLGADDSRFLSQNAHETTRLHLDLEPALSGLSIPLPSPQAGSTSATQSFSGDGQPTCIAPDVLSHRHIRVKFLRPLNGQVQSREVVDLERDDTSAIPQHGDAQSEQGDVGSSVADEMDVDDAAQDSASEDGDSEDDEPSEDTTDIQSNLLRDAGAQYSSASEVHFKVSPLQAQLGVDTSQPIDLDDETQASAVIQSLINKGKLGDILKKFGYPAPEDADTKEQKLSANSSAASDNGRRANQCQKCPKTFARRCELKKHLKRHAKPYACTFARCDKRFGSKNDWKRHENSQHIQLEIWRCAEKHVDHRPDNQQHQECGKVCHRRESLKLHLERDHGIRDPAALDRKLAECRMGRNFESRFWCGFCQKTIEPTGKGGPAHSERFDHIDDHFNGRGVPKADIRDWKHVDMDPLESPGGSPGRGNNARSLASAVRGAAGVNHPRKRAHGGDGDSGLSRAKRLKDGRVGGSKDVFWLCCFCGGFWMLETTKQCLNNGCEHACCDNCHVEREDVDEHEVPPQAPQI